MPAAATATAPSTLCSATAVDEFGGYSDCHNHTVSIPTQNYY